MRHDPVRDQRIGLEGRSGIMDSMAMTQTIGPAQAATPRAYTTEAARWRAVRERDSRADGAFWYSVRTTGVYCRPGCAARPALRENVAFHDSQDAARRAGFRPCKRCKPDQPSAVERSAALIGEACRAIEAAETPPDLAQLAAAAGMSRHHFHRLFKSITGVTPKGYAAAHRAGRVRDGLARAGSVTEAIYDAGFNSSGRFYEQSAAMLGMTPGAFRAGGKGEVIRFALGRTSLGTILVAATEKGVCAISLGDEPEPLMQGLRKRFAKARLVGGDAQFEALVARVVALVETPGAGAKLPLDLRGTAFQLRVWRALQKVPAGTTTTYARLARGIGDPAAVRAVANAVAANPVAVAVPCHRVIRTDGSKSGYRWGVARKLALLAREGTE